MLHKPRTGVNGDKFYFTLTARDKTNLDLTYQCGHNKRITLHMMQYHKKHHIHTTISATSSDAIDVFETHNSKETYYESKNNGGYGHSSGHQAPGKLSWRLSN